MSKRKPATKENILSEIDRAVEIVNTAIVYCHDFKDTDNILSGATKLLDRVMCLVEYLPAGGPIGADPDMSAPFRRLIARWEGLAQSLSGDLQDREKQHSALRSYEGIASYYYYVAWWAEYILSDKRGPGGIYAALHDRELPRLATISLPSIRNMTEEQAELRALLTILDELKMTFPSCDVRYP